MHRVSHGAQVWHHRGRAKSHPLIDTNTPCSSLTHRLRQRSRSTHHGKPHFFQVVSKENLVLLELDVLLTFPLLLVERTEGRRERWNRKMEDGKGREKMEEEEETKWGRGRTEMEGTKKKRSATRVKCTLNSSSIANQKHLCYAG